MYLYACWRRKGEFGAGKEGRRRISLGGAVRDKGEGDVPSMSQLMSAYEDRSRHLAGETLLFYGVHYIRPSF